MKDFICKNCPQDKINDNILIFLKINILFEFLRMKLNTTKVTE